MEAAVITGLTSIVVVLLTATLAYLANRRQSLRQLALWRAWVTNVFMPANRRMREVIVDRADLLRGDTMPEELIAFCAHVATLEELIARWDRGDVSVSTPIYAYPGASFDPHTTLSLVDLRQSQS
jgi:hypothetical protein